MNNLTSLVRLTVPYERKVAYVEGDKEHEEPFKLFWDALAEGDCEAGERRRTSH